MPQGDNIILIGVGVLFLLLGLVGILWGGREEKTYFDGLASKGDLREFVDHWPERPQPGSLRIGGWIAIILGFVLVVMGAVIWFLNRPL